MIKHIFAIHGAYSTPRIFNYLKYRLDDTYTWTFLNYQDEVNGLEDIISNVKDLDEPHHVIGHSMGGLIGLKLLSKDWVSSVSTIATPLGGIELNIVQRYLSRGSFMNDIADYSNFIQSIKNIKTTKPIQHIISTVGFNPWIYEPNDGVITVKSQLDYSLGTVHKIDANHIESVLLDKTRQLLLDFWKHI